jgi:hypothetical protein
MPQKFIEALIYDKENIADFINKDELASSKRSGISYDGIKNKVLIGIEIPKEIKEGIRSSKYQYTVKEELLADGFTTAVFSVPSANYEKLFYFNEGFVPSSTYYTRLWEKKESKYFKFRISEPKYFNDYCIKRLDDFVDMIADTLGYTITEKTLLEKEKILYTFCNGEAEVKMMTGYGAKGMALLGGDEVVTSYQTHFHEVAHILINFKLRKLGLYTLPFFMEGFAVAVGGRGGMAPRVVTDIGFYLQKTSLLTCDSILTDEQFRSNDGSMSYPVSGLYNSFLLGELGGEKYLELYKKVNGNLDFVKTIDPLQISLPENEKFEKFMTDYQNDKVMYVDANDTTKTELDIKASNGNFAVVGDYVKFFTKDKYSVGFGELLTFEKYCSRKFSELYKTDKICYFKYCILTNDDEIGIYNLLNDELIYSYNKGLSSNPVNIPYSNGYYIFFIRSELFGKDFHSEMILQDETFR